MLWGALLRPPGCFRPRVLRMERCRGVTFRRFLSMCSCRPPNRFPRSLHILGFFAFCEFGVQASPILTHGFQRPSPDAGPQPGEAQGPCPRELRTACSAGPGRRLQAFPLLPQPHVFSLLLQLEDTAPGSCGPSPGPALPPPPRLAPSLACLDSVWCLS